MLDKIRDLIDRIPRPGELDGRSRAFAGAGISVVVVIIVVLVLWATGAFGSDSTSDTAEGDGLPYGQGIVECDRFPAEDATAEESALGAAAEGGVGGLPYRANLGESTIEDMNGTTIAMLWVCMEPDATRDQITDTATVMARNIKADYANQASLDALVVRYLGTGDLPLKDLTTYWPEHTFSKDVPIAEQRRAWDWDDDPSN